MPALIGRILWMDRLLTGGGALLKTGAVIAAAGAAHQVIIGYLFVSPFIYALMHAIILVATGRFLFLAGRRMLQSFQTPEKVIADWDSRLNCQGNLLTYHHARQGTLVGSDSLTAAFVDGVAGFLSAHRPKATHALRALQASAGAFLVAGLSLGAITAATGSTLGAAYVHGGGGTGEGYILKPKQTSFLRGSSLVLNVEFQTADGRTIQSWSDRDVYLLYRSTQAPDSDPVEHLVSQDGYHISAIEESFTFSFRVEYKNRLRGSYETKSRKISAYDPAHFTAIQTYVNPPGYLRGYLQVSKSEGDISGFPSSTVSVNVKANTELGSARLEWKSSNGSGSLNLQTGQPTTADGRLTFALVRNATYRITGTDTSGNPLLPSPYFQMRLQKDLEPSFRIRGEGRQIAISDPGILELHLIAEDDFAVAGAHLVGLLGQSVIHHTKIETEQKPVVRAKIEIDLTKMNLERGQTLDFYLLGHDNAPIDPADFHTYQKEGRIPLNLPRYVWRDFKKPGQWRKSSAFRIYFRSYEEKLTAENTAGAQKLAKLKEIYEAEKNSRAELKRLREDIQSGRKLSAKNRQKLKNLLEKSKQTSDAMRQAMESLDEPPQDSSEKAFAEKRKVEAAKQSLAQSLEEKILRKEQRLEQLVRKLGLDYKTAYQQIKMLEDLQYLEKLDQSIQSLENQLLEARLAAIRRKLSNLEKKQQDLVVQSLAEQNGPTLGELQKELSEDIRNLQKETQDLSQSSMGKKLNMAGKLNKLAKSGDWQQADQSSSRAAQEFGASDFEAGTGAARQGEQALKRLGKDMDKALQKLRMRDLKLVIDALDKGIYEIIEVNRVLHEESDKLPANISDTKKGEADRERYRRMARLVDHLRSSLYNSVDRMEEKVRPAGIINPAVFQNFRTTKNRFSGLKTSLERQETSQVQMQKRILESSINRSNAQLLAILEKLRNMAKQQQAAMQSAGQQQQQSNQMQAGQAAQQIFGRQRQGKGLSKQEQSYLDYLLQEQGYSSGGSKPSDSAQDSQESQANQTNPTGGPSKKELEELSQLIKEGKLDAAKQKQSELNKRYLKSNQARVNRGQKKERKSSAAKIDYPLAPGDKISDELLRPGSIEFEEDETEVRESYVPEEKEFYRRYIRSLRNRR